MKYSFWFVVGSQFLYGPEVLETVAARAQEMAEELSKALPFPLLYKVSETEPEGGAHPPPTGGVLQNRHSCPLPLKPCSAR